MNPSTPPDSSPSASESQWRSDSSVGGTPIQAGPIATIAATRSGSASARAVSVWAPIECPASTQRRPGASASSSAARSAASSA